jgi:hypothetical protein
MANKTTKTKNKTSEPKSAIEQRLQYINEFEGKAKPAVDEEMLAIVHKHRKLIDTLRVWSWTPNMYFRARNNYMVLEGAYSISLETDKAELWFTDLCVSLSDKKLAQTLKDLLITLDESSEYVHLSTLKKHGFINDRSPDLLKLIDKVDALNKQLKALPKDERSVVLFEAREDR